MYSIIIVEDEEFSANALAKILDWENYGFTLTKVFTSSAEALEYLKHEQTDAVLTDISMPEVSGIEIARYCHYHSPNTMVVFLSAYSDFEYAKYGIQYKIFSYLNKPVMKSTLSKTLSELCAHLNQVSHKSQFINCTTNSIIRKCFIDILTDNSEIEAAVDLLRDIRVNIDIKNSIFAYLSFEIPNLGEYLKTKWSHGREKLIYAAEQIINAEHPPAFSCMTYFYDTGFDIFLISKPEITRSSFEQFLDSYVSSLTELLRECLYIEIVPDSRIITSDISELKDYIKSRGSSRDQANAKYKIDALEKAKKYIDSNYAENISLNGIAAIVGFEASYFSKIFKQHFGESFSGYLAKVRIEAAKTLLTDSRIKITQIPAMIGLANFSNFSKQFKTHTNYLPSEYRSKYGKM